MKSFKFFQKNNMSEATNRMELAFNIGVGIFLFVVLFVWGIIQPITGQPDELTRYMIPYYIFSHGKLPNGNLEELLVRGYGISYGFFPCLPYIFMAFAMKIVSLFTSGSYAILMGARVVNMLAGVVTYIYVRKIAGKLFNNKLTGWMFTFIICFWPQVMFIFTYTNCDAFAYMSTAIISYYIIDGLMDGFDNKNIIGLSIGFSICLLSYFNAYGMILGAGVLFLLTFVRVDVNQSEKAELSEVNVGNNDKSKKTLHFDSKAFWKYGILLAVITILLSAWWFVRNAILYNGDFIGMEANRICAEANAVDYLKPSMKDTLKNQGQPMIMLLKDSSYMFLLKQSFFGRFGNMDIAAPNYMIRFLKLFLAVSFVGLFVPCKNKIMSIGKRLAYYIGFGIAFITPVFLCFYYSYADDYQPQGRYMLPGLIPLICILFIGIRNIELAGLWLSDKKREYYNLIYKCISICVIIYFMLMAIGCVSLIWKNDFPLVNETFAFTFNGNLYE